VFSIPLTPKYAEEEAKKTTKKAAKNLSRELFLGVKRRASIVRIPET